jgi:hypothetical protein
MNIEALLKLKCQQALAQGDYDLVSSYSQQLIMLQQGTLLQDLPIIEELNELKFQHTRWLLNEDEELDILVLFKQFYGEDLGSVCLDFFYEFGGAELYDAIWSSKQ